MIPQGAVWVVCAEADATGRQLLFKARELAGALPVLAVAWKQEALAPGADIAVLLEGADADLCRTGSLLASLFRKAAPEIVLFPATVDGRALSAWVAAKLQTGLTADCTDLSLTPEGLLLQTRPAFGGRWMADILCGDRRPQMASVRPDVFPTPTIPPTRQAPIERVVEEAGSYLTLRSRVPLAQNQALADAPVVVAGGKGIGSRKGFEKLECLAGLLGGAVGATRSAVDAGFADYSQQIGQTGRIVRPKLYLALAISGMAQHVLGMRDAQTVVAVNRDRQAPIFSYANHGIVSDWEETVDAWIRAMEERERKRKE